MRSPAAESALLQTGWNMSSSSTPPNRTTWDDEPFLLLNLKSLTNGAMSDDEIETLEHLRREMFNADRIIEQARERLLKEDLVRPFGEELRSPSDELTKLFLQRADLTSPCQT